jgi:hypothetical protein
MSIRTGAAGACICDACRARCAAQPRSKVPCATRCAHRRREPRTRPKRASLTCASRCGLTFDMSGGTKAKPLGRPLDGGVRRRWWHGPKPMLSRSALAPEHTSCATDLNYAAHSHVRPLARTAVFPFSRSHRTSATNTSEGICRTRQLPLPAWRGLVFFTFFRTAPAQAFRVPAKGRAVQQGRPALPFRARTVLRRCDRTRPLALASRGATQRQTAQDFVLLHSCDA